MLTVILAPPAGTLTCWYIASPGNTSAAAPGTVHGCCAAKLFDYPRIRAAVPWSSCSTSPTACSASSAATARAARSTDFVDVPGVYPAGRLDADSEGLVVLTDDGALQARIADPRFKLPKTYWVQVEGTPTRQQLDALRHGVDLGGFRTRARAACVDPASPPASGRARRRSACAWPFPPRGSTLTIAEGRNRQVRRMTAAVGLPTLRLIRWSVGAVDPRGPCSGRVADRRRRPCLSGVRPAGPRRSAGLCRSRRSASADAARSGRLRRSLPLPSMIRRLLARLLPGRRAHDPRVYGPDRASGAPRPALAAARRTSRASCRRRASRPSSSAARSATCCSASSPRISTSRPTRRRSRSSRCSAARSSSAAASGSCTCTSGTEVIEVSTFRAAQTGDDATDEHGRLLSDNVYGSQAEDARAARLHDQRALFRSGDARKSGITSAASPTSAPGG